MSTTLIKEKLLACSPAILPSLLLCDFACLKDEVRRLEDAGVAALHLDVMDGVFVPNFTYGMTIVEALDRVTDLPLDVHLMMVNPQKYIRQFVEAGADLLTVHIEAVNDPLEVVQQIREAGCAPGMAINPGTPVSQIEACLPHLDLALVMSVEAGFGGQSFNSGVLTKFQEIRQATGGQEVLLQIDGGIGPRTIAQAASHGAQLMVAGSSIFKQSDYSAAISAMMSQISCCQ
jgi:ribulose-phosphate 3-epimerase